MGMMKLDQASLLRELMSKMQQSKAYSVAALSTSDMTDGENLLERFAQYSSKTLQKKLSLLGIEKNKNNFEEVVLAKSELKNIKEEVTPYLTQVNGKLGFVSSIRNDKIIMEKFIKEMKKIEEESEIVLYYAGQGLEPTPINLSLISNRFIIMMKPTTKSYMEVIKMVKIFSKTNAGNSAGIIVDTVDQEIFEEQIKKIQDYCWSEFNYNIEPIGFFETKYLPLLEDKQIFEGFDLEYLTNKKEMKIFSDSVSSMTF